MAGNLLLAPEVLDQSPPTPTEELIGGLGMKPPPSFSVIYRVKIDRAIQVEFAQRLAAMVEGGTVEIRNITVMPNGELRIGVCTQIKK